LEAQQKMPFQEKAPVLFVTAIRTEHQALASGLGYRGRIPRTGETQEILFFGKSFLSLHTGMGPEPAGQTLLPILSRIDCSAVVSTGYCGALRAGLPPSQVMVYERCLLLDPAEEAAIPPPAYVPDQALFHSLLSHLRKRYCSHQVGCGITIPRVVSKGEEKKTLGARWNGSCVDMETAVVFACAGQYRIPCLAVRIVLDDQAQDLPDFSGWTTPEGTLSLSPPGVMSVISKFQPILFKQWRESERKARSALENLGKTLSDFFREAT
jgi:nucleoside phosphorylase